jgi:hypothetical protein
MKNKALERIKKRLVKDAPIAPISLRLPARMVEELKEIAKANGFSSYRALIRYYLSQGMRADIDILDGTAAKPSDRALRMPTLKEEAAIRAAAKADPNAQPLTPAQLKKMAPLRSLKGK